MKYADGRVHEGDYKNGVAHGRGTWKRPDGTVQECDWAGDIWLAVGAAVSDDTALSAPVAQLSLAAPSHAVTETAASLPDADADADADAAADAAAAATAGSDSSDEDSRSVNSWEFDEDD